jgi:predicted AlkP superfamily phosphohydrolase/phosphomutase
MKTRFLAVVLAVAGLSLTVPACRTGAPEGARAARVVMVSFDGLGAPLLDRWLANPTIATPGGLGGMADQGLKAERVRMVNPTLTAVNHASLITGALPAKTGVVSNTYRTRGDSLNRRTNGFGAASEVPPLWVRTRDAGLRTGILLWPGADFSTRDLSGDFGISWPVTPLLRPELVELDPIKAQAEPELPSVDGMETLRWRLPVVVAGEQRIQIEIAVMDAEPDGRSRYQTIAVRTEGEVSWRYLKEREWFETTLKATGPGDLGDEVYGAWSKILHLDIHRGGLRLYRGAFNRLLAFPRSFSDRLTPVVGPWPGVPDEKGLQAWWLDMGTGIDLDTYVEQVERLDRYLDAVATWVMDNEDFDFLLAYHPSPDEFLHAGLIVEKDQWAWSEGAAFAAREALNRCGRSIDRSVVGLWSGLNPVEDVLVVVSDHGLMPLHDEVLLNRALADAGLVETVEKHGRLRVADTSPLAVVTSGGMGHVYCNIKGRDPGGVVPRKEAGELLRRAARVLADIGVEGEPVIETIADREELAALGLDHPNSGDLVVFLKPGYAASSRLDGKVIRPSRYYGQHGYLNHHDALCGIFMARGTAAGRGRLKEIQSIDIVPRVASWLGLSKRK